MATEEELKGIILRTKERSISINRVPKEIKEEFVKLASEKFVEDYGFTLKWLLEQAMEYQKVKEFIFTNIIEKISQLEKKGESQNSMKGGNK